MAIYASAPAPRLCFRDFRLFHCAMLGNFSRRIGRVGRQEFSHSEFRFLDAQ